MGIKDFDPNKLEWHHGEDDELVVVHDDDTHWAAAAVGANPAQIKWSGRLAGRVTNAERDTILRVWSSNHPYCWQDKIIAAEQRVRRQVIAQ